MRGRVPWVTAALIWMGAMCCGCGAEEGGTLIQSPGKTTYRIDPVNGDDAHPAGQPWKTFGKLNSVRLAAGDTVLIAAGLQDETLCPSGEGAAGQPVEALAKPLPKFA